MQKCRVAPVPAAETDGEEANYSCRICFEDAKPSEVSRWAEQQLPGCTASLMWRSYDVVQAENNAWYSALDREAL
jgi:hypothetical protein